MKKYHQNIKGLLDPVVLEKLSIPQPMDDNTKIVMCGFSEFDISIGAMFNYIIINGKHHKIDGILTFVTQQYGKPFQEIPVGWKTIGYIQVIKDDDFWKNVPIVRDWYDETSCETEIGFDDSL